MRYAEVSFWGRGRVPPDIRVIVQRGETLSTAIIRRLRRKDHGISFAGGPRIDSTRKEDGAKIMQATLGRRVKGGGYLPIAEVWWVEPKRTGTR